jgi:hypothetical protein
VSRTVFLRGFIAAIIASVADIMLFLLARAAGIPFDVPVPLLDTPALPWYVIAIVAGGAALAGTGLAWLLGRKTPDSAAGIFTWSVLVAALLSCVPLLALGLGASSTAALSAMHILPGIVVLVALQPVLRRESARFKV